MLDHHNTTSTFNGGGWDPNFEVMLDQDFQHGQGHPPVGYYNVMATSPPTSTSGTATTMTVPPHKSSTSSPSLSHHHPYTHPNVYRPNHHQQQHIANPPPPFHNLNQPDDGLIFEPSSPSSHDLSPVQSQGHLAVGQTEVAGQHSCMWADCHAVFVSLQDLVAHVNVQHLQTVSTSLAGDNQLGPSQDSTSNHHQSTLDSTGQVFPSCHWGGCRVYPTVEDVPGSSDRPLDAALGVLAAHLWEYHLGLPTPPPQFNSPSAANSVVAQDGGTSAHSPSSEGVTPRVRTPPTEVEMMDMVLPTIPGPLLAAEADPVSDALTSPRLGPSSAHDHAASPSQSQDHNHDQGHDCATSDHPCKWLNCRERFTSCEALMTHITADHVGGGKNHYGCFWDGCGRNGENEFKSKQKICRHLQVRLPSRARI